MMLNMCSEWVCKECSPLLSIHATAANCRQRELGMVCALRGICLNQPLQLQRSELPLCVCFSYVLHISKVRIQMPSQPESHLTF